MLSLTILAAALMGTREAPAQASNDPVPGQLTIIEKDGKAGVLCPLEKTSVVGDISGFGARVTVSQTFQNPTNSPIEAVYTFPLPQDAAVDRMTMTIGNRVIEAEIKRREEARRVYEAAKNAGQSAALLDQERPNVFTQSVANIMPGAKVKINISYVQMLKFEEGQFEFVFPMVVGHRFTANAPDPGKISPPIVPKGTRSGANIELSLNLNAGAPIQEMKSVLHKVTSSRLNDERMQIRLAKANEIPNRDFILRYRVSTDTVQDSFITHMGEKGGFFTLMLMPPKAPTAQQIAPKEIIFVMDQSGSQQGFPIDKSKELTLKMIKALRKQDTFNVLGFNNSVYKLWKEARPNTEENLNEAIAFVTKMQANGGTQLEQGVIEALSGQNDPERLRIVLFNTDGFAGDEFKILDTIQKQRARARMFTFGIGNSVNRFLIDQMSFEGKGDAEYVTLGESADDAVNRFVKRTQSPILTEVSATFEGVDVQDALPREIPDVFSEKPVIITGRYSNPGKGKLTLTGKLGGEPWSKTIDLDFPTNASAPALESLWARQRVDELSRRNHLASAYPEASRVTNEDIISVALEFGIMSQFTSFVAVEKKVVNIGGKQRTVAVPVEMADGVSYEGIFGDQERAQMSRGNARARYMAPTRSSGGIGGGGLAVNSPTRPGTVFKSADASSGLYLAPDESRMKPEERRKYRFENRVDKKLREAKGTVEVEIWLTKFDDTIIAKLKKLGMSIDFSDKGLKVIMGTCDAKNLIEIVQIVEVEKIKKL